MASNFATRKEANAELKRRRNSALKVFNRNKETWRNRKKPLSKPFFVGSEFEWLNL